MGRKMVAVVEVSLGTSGRRKIIMKPTLTRKMVATEVGVTTHLQMITIQGSTR